MKTGVKRRVKLWPETLKAIADFKWSAPYERPDQDAVFLTRNGKRWVRENDTGKRSHIDAVREQFEKLMDATKTRKPKRGFYGLRHSFQTMAENATGDSVAVKFVMGHVDDSMSGEYRWNVSDERIERVTEAVRSWLFPSNQESDR